jgi:hypothetical protein
MCLVLHGDRFVSGRRLSIWCRNFVCGDGYVVTAAIRHNLLALLCGKDCGEMSRRNLVPPQSFGFVVRKDCGEGSAAIFSPPQSFRIP